MYHLPNEIKGLIYEFDNTYREQFKDVLKDISLRKKEYRDICLTDFEDYCDFYELTYEEYLLDVADDRDYFNPIYKKMFNYEDDINMTDCFGNKEDLFEVFERYLDIFMLLYSDRFGYLF